ncbi:MAG: Na+/H+ antiporter NhaC family protein [Richelia sp. RM2_1_2]|nr:Na+/H+ antiporter NhaC family protein [Richelia sp. SM2_1_7]NJM21777.1 Na+/H+ antiporter NhaC family protein [Richelia sp. SM1_7_0]NJN13694.1 Na+/H+ antiporter NhaC family protein [Richelia sp. RM1_1_1]NJO31515.1 Na+/H+ antiporter NhaC family protein [Richelia sp. SL_2_1]NJO64962.1 Na+/H+ antiporter NhaC family protein [Richelia sp. RM2_1_2]
MDLIFFLIISFVLLLTSVFKGYFIVYPLLISIIALFLLLLKRGFKPKKLFALAWAGSKKSFSVVYILLLIGAVIAVWMTAGTVPAIVYYGIQIINPSYFIVSAFLLTILVSLLIGTSFGTVSTIGIALMIMASGSSVNPHLTAGAIIAGAYFGDRCSPMSSSANLIAIITRTKIHTNIKRMLATTFLPLVASTIVYLLISIANPVEFEQQYITSEISRLFNVNPIVLLPAFAILLFAWLRVEIKISMLVSILISLCISIYIQSYPFSEIFRYMLLGFELTEDTSLKNIILGGGVISMAKVSLVVVVSTAFAGLFTGTKILESVQVYLNKAKSISDLFLGINIIGIASAAFGCTQTIAILLTEELVKDNYQKNQLDNYQLAVDLENSVVVLSPLIPWNIAGLVPATILMTDSGFIPFAFYLYFVPLFYYVEMKIFDRSFRN